MKTRLIVLIDFSSYSESLLKLADSWGKILNADLLLVHKIKGHSPAMADQNMREDIIAGERKEVLANLKSLAQKHISDDIHISYEVSDKEFYDFLPKILNRGINDLLLMGLKGTGILKQIFIGSITTQVIENVNSNAVVAVPVQMQHVIPEKLIVAINYKYPLNEEAFSKFLGIFKNRINKLEFISIVTPKEDPSRSYNYLSGVNDKFKNAFPSTFNLFKGDNAFDEIKNYVKKNEDNFLVLQKGSRSLTDQLFRKFFINQLVYEAGMPIIVIP